MTVIRLQSKLFIFNILNIKDNPGILFDIQFNDKRKYKKELTMKIKPLSDWIEDALHTTQAAYKK